VRNTLLKVRRRHREALTEDVKRVYRQRDEAGFRQAFQGFKQEWGRTYPELISSWEAEIDHLVSYLRYPEEIRPYLYTTHALERFIKEVKRRSKVIEAFPGPDACQKVLYLVAQDMDDRYRRRAVKDFWLVKKKLLSIRKAKYGSTEAQPPQPCLSGHTQNY